MQASPNDWRQHYGRNSVEFWKIKGSPVPKSTSSKVLKYLFVCVCLVVCAVAIHQYVPNGDWGLDMLGMMCVVLVALCTPCCWCYCKFEQRKHPVQLKTAINGIHDWMINIAPGEMLEVVHKDGVTSKIIIPRAKVDASGKMRTTAGWSLRRSLDMTLTDEMKNCRYASEITKDDPHLPEYLLHGWTSVDLETAEELWCAHAGCTSYAAACSWADRQDTGFTDVVRVHPVNEDVLGRVVLMRMNKQFLEGDRVYRLEPTVNGRKRSKNEIGGAEISDPAATGKVIVRNGYEMTKVFGNFKQNEPDAFIFKGNDVIKEAGLQIVHTWEIAVEANSANTLVDARMPLLA